MMRTWSYGCARSGLEFATWPKYLSSLRVADAEDDDVDDDVDETCVRVGRRLRAWMEWMEWSEKM